MKKLIILLAISSLLFSCADSKTFVINEKEESFEPYGWIDENDLKDERIIYKVNVGNIVWDCILVETIFVPILLTGFQLYEPYKLKKDEGFQNVKDTIIINYKQ